jgi:hypothetical protein
MKTARAATRRYLPSSPFQAPAEGPPPEQYAPGDLVTHDRHGLGHVIAVEEDIAIRVRFAATELRVTTPYSKLTKL